MDKNWRSGKGSKGIEVQNDNFYNKTPQASRNGNKYKNHRKAQDGHTEEAGSGFARNNKWSGHGQGRSDYGGHQKSGFPQQRNQLEDVNKDLVELGKVYDGVVKAVKYGRRGCLFCEFNVDEAGEVTVAGIVHKILYNNKERRPFEKGDFVQVQCVTKDHEVELSLTSEYVRPLIVLDINGPLGNRSTYDEKEQNKIRSFTKRSHLDEFLAFVSAHFEVAVWSCSTRKNIELNIFSGINLVFVWSQDESTSLYPRTSFISPAKPLFLKEMGKVWRKYPCFSEMNTILVDNHLEKFERNPYGSGIIVPDMTEGISDEVLACDGELCQHLLAMVETRPIDVIGYISKRGGSSPLFPATYPTPPPGNVVINESDSQTDCKCSASERVTDSTSETKKGAVPDDYSLVWSYLLTACNQNSKFATDHMSKKSIPGPKATTLRRKDIADIATDEYVVCEKTDGERAILVINPDWGLVYFVKRNLQVKILSLDNSSNQQELSTWALSLKGLTILDGELVSEHVSDRALKNAFLCFDAVMVNGDFIGKRHGVTLMDRILMASEFLFHSKLYYFAFSSSPLIFKCKTFSPMADIAAVVSKLTPISQNCTGQSSDQIEVLGWVYDEKNKAGSADSFPHLSDGLIFTPIGKTYYDYLAYKWKPPNLCTVDFSVHLDHVRKAIRQNVLDISVPGSTLGPQNNPYPLNDIFMTKKQAEEVIKCTTKVVVVECTYVVSSSRWVLKKVRLDRPQPNALKTAWRILEVVAENLKLESVVEAIALYLNAPEPNVTSSASEVSKHYDLVQASRQSGFREERIAMHRKVMNWSKACLFKSLINFTPTTCDVSHATLLSGLYEQQHLFFADISNFPNLNAPLENERNGKRVKRLGCDVINVLDIACGRGGDIKKFTSDNVIGAYVGVDISPEQLNECQERLQHNRRVRKYLTCLGDASLGTWDNEVRRALGIATCHSFFDYAWCMFALHYFCDSEVRLRNLFLHVTASLKFGGKVAFTFPNPYYICEHLKNGDKRACDDKIYKVNVDEDCENSTTMELDDYLDTFGISYRFSLGDAVQDCKEFVVPIKRVLQIAAGCGLKVSYFDSCDGNDIPANPFVMSMNSWISNNCLSDENLSGLRKAMGVVGPRSPGRELSLEEWEAISLYMCAVWTKVE